MISPSRIEDDKSRKDELIEKLHALVNGSPSEENHIEADGLLVAYIDDEDIAEAYHAIRKWFA
jgi:hypothetical protein